MSEYPSCIHGHNDPNVPCPKCDGSRKLAESIYESHVAPLREEIRELTEQRDRYFDALESIKSLRWGNDGDCGALAIIDKVL